MTTPTPPSEREPTTDEMLFAERVYRSFWRITDAAITLDQADRSRIARMAVMIAAEVERATAHLKQLQKSSSEDWAEDHTHLQQLCLSAGCSDALVHGDSHGVPGIIDLADMLVAVHERITAELRERPKTFGEIQDCANLRAQLATSHQREARLVEALKPFAAAADNPARALELVTLHDLRVAKDALALVPEAALGQQAKRLADMRAAAPDQKGGQP